MSAPTPVVSLADLLRQCRSELVALEGPLRTQGYWGAADHKALLIKQIDDAIASASSESSESDSAMLVRLIELIRAMDLQATKITHVEGDEDVVDGYKFNTGCWHRILGMVAGHEASQWIRSPEGQARIHEASERARATIEELEKARAIDWDKFRNWRATF